MNIQIIGDNFDVTDSTQLLVAEKIGAKLDKYLAHLPFDIDSALIRIQKDKFDIYHVNFDMNLPGKTNVYAETNHKILESALIDLEEAVEKQIQKFRHE